MSGTDSSGPKPIRIAGIELPVADQAPLVLALVEVIARQEREIRELKDEIQKLKGTTRRPKIAPSKLLKPDKPKRKPGEKRPGSAKRSKKPNLQVTDTIALTLEDLPEGR